MTEREYRIDGMSCNHCVMGIKAELSKLNIDDYEVEIDSAKVKFDESDIKESQIIDAIEEAGYKVIN